MMEAEPVFEIFSYLITQKTRGENPLILQAALQWRVGHLEAGHNGRVSFVWQM
jgi:hypothetical protein